VTVPVVRVGDIAEQIRGVTFAKSDAVSERRPGYVPVLRAGNIQDGGLDMHDLLYVPASRVRDKQRVRRNDVLIAASSGSLDVVGKAARSRTDFDGGFGAFCKVLRPTAAVDPAYFAHFFQTPRYRREVASLAEGANINNLKNEHLNDLAMPLPSMEEQRRIAAILDHADDLQAKRRVSLDHLDDLAQSIFLGMFPTHAFPSASAGELMPDMRNGSSPVTAGEYPAAVLTLSAVTRGAFDPTAVKDGLFAIDPPPEKRVSASDFLICRGNGNPALVGAGVFSEVNRPELVFPDTVIAGKVDNSKVTLPVLDAAWKQPEVRRQIRSVARTTNGTYKVNQQTLSSVTISLPPLRLQREFDARIHRVKAQRLLLCRAKAIEAALLVSLRARAFGGGL
jgi:type I restriction enzyme S subunit